MLGEAIRHQGEIHERDLERELPEALPHDDWMKLRAENADIKVLPGKGFEDIAFLADLTPTASPAASVRPAADDNWTRGCARLAH